MARPTATAWSRAAGRSTGPSAWTASCSQELVVVVLQDGPGGDDRGEGGEQMQGGLQGGVELAVAVFDGPVDHPGGVSARAASLELGEHGRRCERRPGRAARRSAAAGNRPAAGPAPAARRARRRQSGSRWRGGGPGSVHQHGGGLRVQARQGVDPRAGAASRQPGLGFAGSEQDQGPAAAQPRQEGLELVPLGRVEGVRDGGRGGGDRFGVVQDEQVPGGAQQLRSTCSSWAASVIVSAWACSAGLSSRARISRMICPAVHARSS